MKVLLDSDPYDYDPMISGYGPRVGASQDGDHTWSPEGKPLDWQPIDPERDDELAPYYRAFLSDSRSGVEVVLDGTVPFGCNPSLDEGIVKGVREYLKPTHQVIDLGRIGWFRVFSVKELSQVERTQLQGRGAKLGQLVTRKQYERERAKLGGDAAPLVATDTLAGSDFPKLVQRIEKTVAALQRLGARRQSDTLVVTDLTHARNPITGGGVGGYAKRAAHTIEVDYGNFVGGNERWAVELLAHEWGHKHFFMLPRDATEFVRNWYSDNVLAKADALAIALPTADDIGAVVSAARAAWDKSWEQQIGIKPRDYRAWRTKMQSALAAGDATTKTGLNLLFSVPGRVLLGTASSAFRNPAGGAGIRKGDKVTVYRPVGAATEHPGYNPKKPYMVETRDKLPQVTVWATEQNVAARINPDYQETRKVSGVDLEMAEYALAKSEDDEGLNFFTRENRLFNALDEAVRAGREVLSKKGFALVASDYFPLPSYERFTKQWIALAQRSPAKFDPERVFTDLFPKVASWKPDPSRVADEQRFAATMTIGAPEGRGTRDNLARKGVVPSSYAASNVDELWAETIAKAATDPSKLSRELRDVLKAILQGNVPKAAPSPRTTPPAFLKQTRAPRRKRRLRRRGIQVEAVIEGSPF